MSKLPADYRRPVDRFFALARERQSVHLRKEAGLSWPWTDDEVLRQYKFCNVFREQDRVTRWFRQNVRQPMRGRPEVLLATVLFRMFNTVSVGEAVFQQPFLDGGTAFERYLHAEDARELRRAIVNYIGRKGPYTTGAYIISTPPGHKKLDGVLKIVSDFAKKSNWRAAADAMPRTSPVYSLEHAWRWLGEFDYLGTFHSYEIVTDLSHTFLLERAPDIDSWANIGPGCRRGLNRIFRDLSGREANRSLPAEQALEEMRGLLAKSRESRFWPQATSDHVLVSTHEVYWRNAGVAVAGEQWPRWHMREVEHWLCEFDKWERTRAGEGRPRSVYRHGGKR